MRKIEFQPVCESGGIDIVSQVAGIGIEIETGRSDIIMNLVKLNLSGFKYCFMLTTSKALEIKLKKLEPDFPTVKVLYVKDFLKLTKEEILAKDLQPQIHIT